MQFFFDRASFGSPYMFEHVATAYSAVILSTEHLLLQRRTSRSPRWKERSESRMKNGISNRVWSHMSMMDGIFA